MPTPEQRAWFAANIHTAGRPVRPAGENLFGISLPKIKTGEAMRRYRESEHADPVF